MSYDIYALPRGEDWETATNDDWDKVYEIVHPSQNIPTSAVEGYDYVRTVPAGRPPNEFVAQQNVELYREIARRRGLM